MKYSKELAENIASAYATGQQTMEDICKANGISRNTAYTWLKKNNAFIKLMAEAKELRMKAYGEMAMSGMAVLLTKHEYEEVTTEYTEDKNGKPKIKSQKKVKKFIMPNASMVQYVLNNRLPDDWKQVSKIDHTTDGESLNKGFYDFLKEIATVTDKGDVDEK